MNMINKLFYTFIKQGGFVVYFMPAKFRAMFYSFLFRRMGKNVFIFGPFRCGGPENISIGNEVVLSNNCVIGGEFGLDIGNFVMIAQNTTIVSANHGYARDDVPMMRQDLFGKKIKIEDDVWIGANCTILPGVTIHQGAIVGANSIVTKDVEPYSIVVGNPARLLKKRFSDDRIEVLRDRQRSPLFKYYRNDSRKTFIPTVYGDKR